MAIPATKGMKKMIPDELWTQMVESRRRPTRNWSSRPTAAAQFHVRRISRRLSFDCSLLRSLNVNQLGSDTHAHSKHDSNYRKGQ